MSAEVTERERRAEAEHRCPRCKIGPLNRCRQYEPEWKILRHPHPERVALVGDDRIPTAPQAAVLARLPATERAVPGHFDWMNARDLRDVRPDVLRRIRHYRWAEHHGEGGSYWSVTRDGRRALQRWQAREAQRPRYRCADCGHGKHLEAWVAVTAVGPLGPDGTVTQYDWDEQYDLHEDSIQCTKHVDSVIEHRIGERWCRWWNCPHCDGKGTVRGYECREPGIQKDGTLGKDGPHHGWRPIELLADDQALGGAA